MECLVVKFSWRPFVVKLKGLHPSKFLYMRLQES